MVVELSLGSFHACRVVEQRYFFLAVYLSTVLYVQLRGQVRHKLKRLAADHANVLAPYNTLMYLFSAVRAKPYADVSQFPELEPITAQWQMIRDEALKLFDEGYIRAAASHNDIGFNTFFKHGWKRFYLKWYGDSAALGRALCPRTVALLQCDPEREGRDVRAAAAGQQAQSAPRSVRGLAALSPRPDHAELGRLPHLRRRPAVLWRDGEDVVFDETYVHWAENKTDQTTA